MKFKVSNPKNTSKVESTTVKPIGINSVDIQNAHSQTNSLSSMVQGAEVISAELISVVQQGVTVTDKSPTFIGEEPVHILPFVDLLGVYNLAAMDIFDSDGDNDNPPLFKSNVVLLNWDEPSKTHRDGYKSGYDDTDYIPMLSQIEGIEYHVFYKGYDNLGSIPVYPMKYPGNGNDWQYIGKTTTNSMIVYLKENIYCSFWVGFSNPTTVSKINKIKYEV